MTKIKCPKCARTFETYRSSSDGQTVSCSYCQARVRIREDHQDNSMGLLGAVVTTVVVDSIIDSFFDDSSSSSSSSYSGDGGDFGGGGSSGDW